MFGLIPWQRNDKESAASQRSRTPGWRTGAPLLSMLVLGSILLAGCSSLVTPSPTTVDTSTNSSSTIATSAPPATGASVVDLQTTIENVIQKVQPSVVEITSTGGTSGGEAIGSGEILTSDGYIVTNDHVVDGFAQFQVTLASGNTVTAQLIGKDPNDDLAVLKISGNNLPAISLGDSGKIKVGEFVVAIGTPLGLAQSATFGIVSATNRSASEAPNGPAGTLVGLIQTSAPINPGNSGGALVDLNGNLVGIPTLGAVNQDTGTAANGIGFAIPSDRVQYVAQQLIKYGQLQTTGQGFMGIEGADLTPIIAQQNNLPVQAGVIVQGFGNDTAGVSPAQQAGIQVGDIITAIDGAPVTDNASLAALLISKSPGTTVDVTVQRGNQQLHIKVKLGERPTNAGG